MPQRDILLHPKTLAFITHGGQNSISEATYAAMPLICIPLFSDQARNCEAVVRKGMAERFDKFNLGNEKKIVEVLEKILGDKM